MSGFVGTVRTGASGADKEAVKQQEEGVQVASQWAQEKIDAFLAAIESDDHKLLKVNYIVRRRTSVDIFEGQHSEIGDFAAGLIKNFGEGGKFLDTLSNMTGTILNKLLGASSGSAQTDKLYEVAFDELGGLNRFDGFFFCYRFASSGLHEFTKAVIGHCIVQSAAINVDSNAFRVIITSSATLGDAQRAAINRQLVEVAKKQTKVPNQKGEVVDTDTELQVAKAELSKAIGDGVASSVEHKSKKPRPALGDLTAGKPAGSAEAAAAAIAGKASTNVHVEKPGGAAGEKPLLDPKPPGPEATNPPEPDATNPPAPEATNPPAPDTTNPSAPDANPPSEPK